MAAPTHQTRTAGPCRAKAAPSPPHHERRRLEMRAVSFCFCSVLTEFLIGHDGAAIKNAGGAIERGLPFPLSPLVFVHVCACLNVCVRVCVCVYLLRLRVAG